MFLLSAAHCYALFLCSTFRFVNQIKKIKNKLKAIYHFGNKFIFHCHIRDPLAGYLKELMDPGLP